VVVDGVKAVPAEVVVEVIGLVIEIGDDSEVARGTVEVVLVSEELVILVIEIGGDSEVAGGKVEVVLVSEELVELVTLVIEVGDKLGVNVLVVVDP